MRVCMPYLAQRDREEGLLVAAYLKSVSYFTAVGWPFLLFMAMAAFSAVRIVYGPQWEAAVVLAKILCVACAFEVTHMLSREALLACGQARRASLLQAGLLVLQVLGLLAVAPFGLEGAAWGFLAASALGVALSQWHLHRGIGLRMADMARACWPSALLAIGALLPATLWSLAEGVTAENYIRFGLFGSLATSAAWLLCLRLIKHPMQGELVAVLQQIHQRLRRAA
jgi:O-antigen/teichoic acid export membrane protein